MASPAERVAQLYKQGVRGQALTNRIRRELGLSVAHAELAVARARSSGGLPGAKPLDQDPNAARRALQNSQGGRFFAGQLYEQGYRGDRLRRALQNAGLSTGDATTAIVRAREGGLLPADAYPNTQLPGSSPGAGGGGGSETPAERRQEEARAERRRARRAAERRREREAARAREERARENREREIAETADDLRAELDALFPWASRLGLGPDFFHDLAAETASADEVVARIRGTSQYKKRFPSILRDDGSRLMSEAEYIATEDAYRQQLRQYGFDPAMFENPQDLGTFFDSEIDPNELGERLNTFQDIKDSSQSVKDAFYVYAGLEVGDDDLFEAALDPEAAENLRQEYRREVTRGDLSYEDFLDRVSIVATDRAANLGSINEAEFNQRIGNRQFQRRLLDVLYTAGTGSVSDEPLSLEELLSSYEEAVLGAAATGAGLELPDAERIAEIRMAGIQRAQATQAYQQFALRRRSLSANAVRAGLGEVDQNLFEEAAFLGDTDAARSLDTAEAYGESVGQSGGSFRFGVDPESDRLVQSGLRGY